MPIHIQQADIHLIDLQTRLPFKYGIATMTCAPHAFVRLSCEIDGDLVTGIAADHLPPKWFTKIPQQPLDDEIDEMLRVIQHATEICIGLQGPDAFSIWRQLHDEQEQWGRDENLPPLLSNFGTTLVERALIEAVCKSAGQSFAEAVRTNKFGIALETMDKRLANLQPADLLPQHPRRQVIARHTVGMADPLSDMEIMAAERLNDGLPQSLAACIQQYDLLHFKIKLSGQLEADIDRLQRTADVIQQHAAPESAFTLDGNEPFQELKEFQQYWRQLTQIGPLREFLEHLLFVEQPFHRDVALDPSTLGGLKQWAERPRLIIDESDAERNSLSQALELGYHGTSHKNCKGVFRGITSACLLEKLRRDDPATPYVMSGEDLANIGPVALLQDLTVAATLGIESIERNGHHYFAGLSAFPDTVQEQILENHNDLYYLSPAGWPTLDIERGLLDLRSVIDAPLGVGFELDVEQFLTVEQWQRQRAADEPA